MSALFDINATTTYVAKIKTIKYRNAEGYIIASTSGKLTVKGTVHHDPDDLIGVSISFQGNKDVNKEYGDHFVFTSYTIKGGYGIFFLTKLCGVPKRSAQEIIDKLGDKDGSRLENVIENNPKSLLNIRGISDKRLSHIIAAFHANKHLRSVTEFLFDFDVSPSKVKKIHDFYVERKKNPVEELRRNPFDLIRIGGIGFRSADGIAIKMGLPFNSPFRIQSGLVFVTSEHCEQGGHTYIDVEELYEKSSEILSRNNSVISREELEEALMVSALEKKTLDFVDKEHTKVSLPYLIASEKYIHRTLLDNRDIFGKPILVDIGKYIQECEEEGKKLTGKEDFELDPQQRKAIEIANMLPNVFYISGVAGSGKTSTSKYIMELFLKIYNKSEIVGTALSGVAANRIQTATGFAGRTIHSLLSFKGSTWEFNENNKLPYKVIMLDEAGMVSSQLFSTLLKAIDFTKTHLFIVGDHAQLKSIGSGNVFLNILQGELCKGVQLTTVHRTDMDQVINIFSTEYIRQGKVPEGYKRGDYKDFKFISKQIPNYWQLKNTLSKKELTEMREQLKVDITEEIRQIALSHREEIMKIYISDVKGYINGFQVISPMRSNLLGVEELNKTLQEVFNPMQYSGMLEVGDKIFKPRDKVLHLKNSDRKTCSMDIYRKHIKREKELYESSEVEETKVFNGMIGVILKVMLKEDLITVYYPNEEKVAFYKKKDFAEKNIEHGFCQTTHKSQGSEYKTVCFVSSSSHWSMLNSELVYTACTRAKKMLYVVGEDYAFERGCKNKEENERKTILSLL
ncbi:MAG: AAA family ATPase [Epsilonproteobacteria bacterium]|nr:AAA family ATPase [Campylobacterota bacterium]